MRNCGVTRENHQHAWRQHQHDFIRIAETQYTTFQGSFHSSDYKSLAWFILPGSSRRKSWFCSLTLSALPMVMFKKTKCVCIIQNQLLTLAGQSSCPKLHQGRPSCLGVKTENEREYQERVVKENGEETTCRLNRIVGREGGKSHQQPRATAF
jgi:hypothetical protein